MLTLLRFSPISLRLASFYFAYFAFIAAMVAYFPLYLARRGLDPAGIALVLALPQVARIVAPAAWGWLADRSGAHRAIVTFSCAVMAGVFIVLPHVEGVFLIAGAIALMSVLSAGALPLVEAIALAALSGNTGRYGPVRLWGSISFILVVVAGGVWLDFKPVDALPIALSAIALAALLASLGLPRLKIHAGVPADGKVAAGPAVRSLLAAGFCNSAAHGVLYAFFTLHLQRLGYSGSAIGALWALGVVAEIGVFLCLPALFRRYSLSTILTASLLCVVVRFLAIAWLADMLAILIAAQLLHAATFGSFHAASIAAIHRIFPASSQALGQTLFSSVAYGAGGAAGALLAGWSWQTMGAGAAFSLAALAGALGAYFASALSRAKI